MRRAVIVSLFPTLATIFAASSQLSAQNWPQWRGPSSHGVSAETKLPISWSPSENLAWRASLAGLGRRFSILRHEPFDGGGGHLWLRQTR